MEKSSARLREGISAPYLLEIVYHDDGETYAGEPPLDSDIGLADFGLFASGLMRRGMLTRVRRERSTIRSTRFLLELRPWLWYLTRDRGCRVFQKKSIPDIVAAVCQEAGFANIRRELSREYPEVDYRVQYNESSYSFILRLLAEAGIFYHFSHDGQRHYLVLRDAHDDTADAPGLTWLGDNFPQTPEDSVWDCNLATMTVPKAVVFDDYNFLIPKTSLSSTAGDGSPSHHRFGTGHLDGAGGQSLAAGEAFRLGGCPDKDINGAWIVVELDVHLEEDNTITASFAAVPLGTCCAPPLPEPRIIPGPLTGVVCGKEGKEIWTDEHGRIKVRPHWDRVTEADETASCWMRVVQPWAGAGFGAFFLPRVGDEVVISFLAGNPDRPLVTGSLYNAANTPPWELPDNSHVCGILTRSTPDGDAGNEISLRDKKDEESITIHAQMLLDAVIEEERRVSVMGETGDSLTLEKGPRTTLLKEGDYSLTLDKGTRTVENQGRRRHAESRRQTRRRHPRRLPHCRQRQAGRED
ncbi:MAG: type VI secretion system tip protein VgrG [Planctomycetaceae bacterium]|nr:type VI secretion system tip protein VgrG [Planctomycetaceae bacterium]